MDTKRLRTMGIKGQGAAHQPLNESNGGGSPFAVDADPEAVLSTLQATGLSKMEALGAMHESGVPQLRQRSVEETREQIVAFAKADPNKKADWVPSRLGRFLRELFDLNERLGVDALAGCKGLVVEEDLDLRHCMVPDLPGGLTVHGDLDLEFCSKLRWLPTDLQVDGALNMFQCDEWNGLIPTTAKIGTVRLLPGRYDEFNCQSVTVARGCVSVELDWIGEGWNGDYDPEDTSDRPLMRFTVFGHPGLAPDGVVLDVDDPVAQEWQGIPNASCCTQVSATLSKKKLEAIANYLLDSLCDDVSSGNSIKKICERLSWIKEEDLFEMVGEAS